jgi:hypothetical protein
MPKIFGIKKFTTKLKKIFICRKKHLLQEKKYKCIILYIKKNVYLFTIPVWQSIILPFAGVSWAGKLLNAANLGAECAHPGVNEVSAHI